MSYTFGMVSGSDVTQLRGVIDEGNNRPRSEIDMSMFSDGKEIVLTNGASTLLASGSAVSTTRRALIIRNESEIQVALLPSGATSAKRALYVEPYSEVTINFPEGNTTAVYGRSTGYDATVTVWEV